MWPRLAKAQELHNRHDHGRSHQCHRYGPRRVDGQRQPRQRESKTAEHPRPTSKPLKRLHSGAPPGSDDVGGSILGMALPVTAKYAPTMIMVVRCIPLSGSSTTPYACASVVASGMIIINAPNTTARSTASPLRTAAASPGDRLKASCEPRCTATMTTETTMAAAHAHAAAGLAFQFASASPIATRGKAEGRTRSS